VLLASLEDNVHNGGDDARGVANDNVGLMATINNIDIRNADATRVADKNSIFAVIGATAVGFHALNTCVIDCVRAWVVRSFEMRVASVSEVRSAQTASTDVDVEVLEYDEALASLYLQTGRLRQAFEAFSWCLGHRLETLKQAAADPRVHRCKRYLAQCMSMAGLYTQAVETLRECFPQERAVKDVDTTLASLLANALTKTAIQANLIEAVALHSYVIDQRQKQNMSQEMVMNHARPSANQSGVLEEAYERCDDYMLSSTYFHLAETYVGLGNHEKALSSLAMCFSFSKQAFRGVAEFIPFICSQSRKEWARELTLPVPGRASAHPLVVPALSLLAQVYICKSFCTEARILYSRTAEICREKFGASHPDTLTAVSNLAVSYYLVGLEQQLRYAGREYEVLGTESNFLVCSHLVETGNKGSLHATGGFRENFDRAEELLQLCHARRIFVFGEAHINSVSTLNNFGVVCVALNELEEAERALRRCVFMSYSGGIAVESEAVIWKFNLSLLLLYRHCRQHSFCFLAKTRRRAAYAAKDFEVLEECINHLRSVLSSQRTISRPGQGGIFELIVANRLASLLVTQEAESSSQPQQSRRHGQQQASTTYSLLEEAIGLYSSIILNLMSAYHLPDILAGKKPSKKPLVCTKPLDDNVALILPISLSHNFLVPGKLATAHAIPTASLFVSLHAAEYADADTLLKETFLQLAVVYIRRYLTQSSDRHVRKSGTQLATDCLLQLLSLSTSVNPCPMGADSSRRQIALNMAAKHRQLRLCAMLLYVYCLKTSGEYYTAIRLVNEELDIVKHSWLASVEGVRGTPSTGHTLVVMLMLERVQLVYLALLYRARSSRPSFGQDERVHIDHVTTEQYWQQLYERIEHYPSIVSTGARLKSQYLMLVNYREHMLSELVPSFGLSWVQVSGPEVTTHRGSNCFPGEIGGSCCCSCDFMQQRITEYIWMTSPAGIRHKCGRFSDGRRVDHLYADLQQDYLVGHVEQFPIFSFWHGSGIQRGTGVDAGHAACIAEADVRQGTQCRFHLNTYGYLTIMTCRCCRRSLR
jgi:tetratricopeptide (TPR) repeat protein